MKKVFSQVEIAFWDTTISLMSREKMPRVYTQTLAALTLRLQPIYPQRSLNQPITNINLRLLRWLRLVIISLSSLALGLLLGWLSANF